MKIRSIIILLSVLISFAFEPLPVTSFVAGRTWYFHSITDDYIEFKLSKPDASGNGNFSWTVGVNITDKREGKYILKNNILILDYYWAGVKTATKIYKIEHETKKGFLLIEQSKGGNVVPKSFLFTSSQ
jgi:hypothetical protein